MGSTPPFLRTPNNYDTNAATAETALVCADPSRTRQSEADEADINTIVRRFGLTGTLPDNIRMPQYADFEEVHNFQDAMNVIVAAREQFMRMPAEIRAEFNNDPAQFHDAVLNPENETKLRRLGLLKDKPEEPPIQAEPPPVNPKKDP